MVNQDQDLHYCILDIFEEYEDTYFFPVRTQNDARSFVKAMHIKGIPYEQIYQSIGEYEHNFSSWKKGLGRPGIGNRVIELINSPLVEILEEEDDLPSTNGHYANGHVSTSSVTKETPKRSWEDNYRVPPTPHQNGHSQTPRPHRNSRSEDQSIRDETDAPPKPRRLSRNEEPPIQEPSKPESPILRLRKVEQLQQDDDKESAPKRMVQLRKTPPREKKLERPRSELELMKQQILSRKSSEESMGDPADKKIERRISLGSSGSDSSSSDSEPRVEAVLEKFDAIKISPSPEEEKPPKKPERLFLEDNNTSQAEPLVKPSHVEPAKNSQPEPRVPEVKKEERQSEEDKARQNRAEILAKAKAALNKAEAPAANTVEVDENYNSDLDPENENQSPVMATLVKKISGMRAAGKNGTGYVYVVSDSAQDAPEVRVKVASSKCPKKRLLQAKRFNPDVWMVAMIPVSQRLSAVTDIHASLADFKLENIPDWFVGDLDTIISLINSGANKYPSKTIADATLGETES